MRTTLTFASLLIMLQLGQAASTADAAERPVAESFLLSGDLAGGEKALALILKEHPDDAQARFGLGMIQFLRGVERLVQSFYKYGLEPDLGGNQLPFARLPVPHNPKPEPIGYDDLRAILQAFVDDLARAERTLAEVKDDAVRLPIRFGLVRLDFDGDGKASDAETLWKIFARVAGIEVPREPAAGFEGEFPIGFDRGDVAWLRGYSHLLSALVEVYLAHDGKTLFEHTSHLFFANPKTPYPFLKFGGRNHENQGRPWFTDLIAFVHLQRYPVKEAMRMEAALKHLEAMITLSRESWKFYLAETDNDHEWIPNPTQETVMPGGKVTGEMVKSWHELLAELDRILKGKTLVPFWRDAEGKGVNLRKVFTEPRELDLILWVQGTAALPYLEDGNVTQPDFWGNLMRAFRGQFIGFAAWFN